MPWGNIQNIDDFWNARKSFSIDVDVDYIGEVFIVVINAYNNIITVCIITL